MMDSYDELYDDITSLTREEIVPANNDQNDIYDFHSAEDYYHRWEGIDHDKHGTTCWKKAVSRESGFYPTCGEEGEQSGTYCYKKCEKGFTGSGAVCYQDCNNFGDIIPPPIPGSKPQLKNDAFENLVLDNPLVGVDPRKDMHEDTAYCYKKETIPRGPGSPVENQ